MIVAFDGGRLVFENDLEMMRSLGSVEAGSRIELLFLRGSDVFTTEFSPIALAPDRARFAYWLSGNEEEARDVAAETFARAWAGADGLRLKTVKAYLLAIARNDRALRFFAPATLGSWVRPESGD